MNCLGELNELFEWYGITTVGDKAAGTLLFIGGNFFVVQHKNKILKINFNFDRKFWQIFS